MLFLYKYEEYLMLGFKSFFGKQALQDFELYEKMKNVALSHDLTYMLSFLDEQHDINCYYKDDEMIGFSFMTIANEVHLAELCWFVINKNKQGFNSKWFLDKTLEYLKSKGVKSVKFICDLKSWGNIRDKEKLFEKFGYNISSDDFYDISIDL